MPFRNFCYENGYEIKTTFWEDFSIADKLGVGAIRDTYNRAFEEWKNNYVYLTELVLVLNHKIWQLYESNEDVAREYDKLWRKCCQHIEDNFTGEDLAYYYEVID